MRYSSTTLKTSLTLAVNQLYRECCPHADSRQNMMPFDKLSSTVELCSRVERARPQNAAPASKLSETEVSEQFPRPSLHYCGRGGTSVHKVRVSALKSEADKGEGQRACDPQTCGEGM